VSFQRGIDDPDPVGRLSGPQELRRVMRSSVVATGTLACPLCDAPVALAGPVSPAASIECPYCEHFGRVREFLSLEPPTRPARVTVRVVPARLPTRR
jgi:hypothetical protein